MNRRLDWFLARRYLASRKKGRFLSLITWIALGGVTVGVMALVVVLSVMNGAQEDLRGMILGSTPHVLVLEQGSALRMGGWREVLEEVRQVDGVVSAAPFVLTLGALRRGEYAQPTDLYGIDTGMDPAQGGALEEQLLNSGLLGEGREGEDADSEGLPGIALGWRLASRMDLFPGDTVQLLFLETLRPDPFGNPVPAIGQFVVRGTVRTGVYDYDLRNAYAPIPVVQELLGVAEADQVSGISVRVDDPWAATEVGEEIRASLGGFPYFVESWITTNSSMFSALKLEKIAMTVILFLIVVVAAFNIISTLVMVVADRTREIGILKSMGMTDRQVLRVFVLQGVWIGAIGTVVGAAAGLVLAVVLDSFPLISLPPDIYALDRLPVSIDPLDVAVTVVLSIAVALAATIYPSLQASRLQPVEAIRHE